MYTRTIGRLGAAAVLAVGLLIASSAPASASATYVQIIDSSTIQISDSTGNPATNTIHIGDGGVSVCAPDAPPDHIPITNTSTGTITIPAHSTNYGDFIVGTNSFKARLNIVSGSATLTTTGVTVNLVVNAEFRNCASTTLVCRTSNINVTLTGTNPTGTLHPTVSTVFNVSGVSTVITVAAVPSCNVIVRAAIINQYAYVNFGLHFTDSSTPPPG